MGDGIVFRTVARRRIEAIKANPRVCVEVTCNDESGRESVILWGEARFLDETSVRADVIAALLSKYQSESVLGLSPPAGYLQEKLVVAIRPDEITGKSSGSGLHTETRPGRI